MCLNINSLRHVKKNIYWFSLENVREPTWFWKLENKGEELGNYSTFPIQSVHQTADEA